jgi:hypothetical protein
MANEGGIGGRAAGGASANCADRQEGEPDGRGGGGLAAHAFLPRIARSGPSLLSPWAPQKQSLNGAGRAHGLVTGADMNYG